MANKISRAESLILHNQKALMETLAAWGAGQIDEKWRGINRLTHQVGYTGQFLSDAEVK